MLFNKKNTLWKLNIAAIIVRFYNCKEKLKICKRKAIYNQSLQSYSTDETSSTKIIYRSKIKFKKTTWQRKRRAIIVGIKQKN